MRGCLAEDELLGLLRAGGLGEAPEAEAHLADCAACSALVVTLAAGGAAPARWGALAGRSLGPYELLAQIGAGGMGAVYRARDARLGRTVAVKVLPPDSGDRAQLEREARAAAAITHPNVVRVYDVGHDEGVTYVVEELVEGETVRARLARGAPGLDEARRLGIELARGLAAAHAAGVVHRDLKPENLLLAPDGTLKILDFGLAQLDTTDPGGGTIGYMAPEQARGEATDARCDLFAAGAILYELATGRRAFDGATYAERLSATLRGTPPLDGPLAPILARLLEKEPRRRFHSAADLEWALERAGAVPPPASRRAFLAGTAAAAATAAVGLVAGRALAPRPGPPPRYRRLTHRHGRVTAARFTADGDSVLYAATWDGEPIAAFLLRLDGGVAQPLDAAPADVLAVSSRGEVALALARRSLEGQVLAGRLAVRPIAGGEPRPLLDDVVEADFTPDGAALAIVRRDARGFRLELPAGRPLLEEPGWIAHPRVAPDGARVACVVHPSVFDDAGEVLLIDRGAPRAVATGFSSIAGLAWDPGGRALWVAAARDGAECALRRLELDGGERVVAQLTTRVRLHDVAHDRRVLLASDEWRARSFVGAREVSLLPFSLIADLSADGRVALCSEGGADPLSDGVYLRPLDGGRALRLGDGRAIALSPSGTRAAAEPASGAPLVVYRADSAAQPPLMLGPLRSVGSGRFVDEDRLVVSASDGGPQRMWLIAPDAPPRPLTDPGRAGRLEVDPARRRAAFVDAAGRLAQLDLDRRALDEVPGDFSGRRVCGFAAGGAILLRTLAAPIAVTAVEPATGASTAVTTVVPPAIGLKGIDAFLVRGELHAYSYGEERSQLYLMTM